MSKQLGGYSKLVELCKQLGIRIGELPSLQKAVIDVRNKVIHGGHTPLFEDACHAYKDTRQALLDLDVPLFE